MDWPRHIRATGLMVQGRHAAALAEHRVVLEADPSDVPALIAVLQACRERHAVADAIAAATLALTRDPSSFAALDGLAWAYLEHEDHHRAKPVIEEGLTALGALEVGAPFRDPIPRFMLSVARLVLRFPGLRSRFPTLPSTSEMAAESTRWTTEWRAWALSYLAWYQREHGSGSASA